MMVKVGYSPLHYFILGICETFVSLFLVVVVHNTATVSEWISYLADNDVLLFLPVYFVIINFLLFIGVCISIEHIVGYYVDDVLFITCHWFLLRVVSESTSVFFLHAGFGRRSARDSFLVGFLSTAVFATVLLLCYFFGPNYVALIVCGICILLALFVYHVINWLLPLKYFHRRPAAKHFSLLNAIILLLQILTLFAASVSPDGGHDKDTAIKFFFTVTEMFQIIICLFAFSEDSMYWQGLFVDANANLNHPLLGVWEMNSGVIHTAVSRTITHLERKVVKIIPYSHLSVDTTKYFAGGSARVYKGFYDRQEVAIKFLFCIELTPDRVVDFCNEATLLNSLQHPNVVKCFGVAIMPPAISLVTEYCTYGSLFDFLHSTDLVVNDGEHRASLSSGSDSNRVRTSTSDSLGRERTSTSSGRYRANSRLADAMTNRDSLGNAVGGGSGRYRAPSKALTVERDSLSSVNSKSINLEFARRDSEPVTGLGASSGDIEQGPEATIFSPMQMQNAGGTTTAVAPQRVSAGKGFTFSFNWNSGANSTATPSTPLHNPVRAADAYSSPGDGQNEHLVRYMDAESMDIASRLAEAMTNKAQGGVSLSQKHSHEPHNRSRNNSLRWLGGTSSYHLPRLPSLQGGGGGDAGVGASGPAATVESRMTPPPPPAEPRYFAAPSSIPSTPRIRSATAVLLSKDMGFGLGPNAKLSLTRNKDTGGGGGSASTAVTPGGVTTSGTAGGGVRQYSVSRPSSPITATPNKKGNRGSRSHGKGSKSRLSNASLLVGLINPPSVHSVGRLLPPATKLRMARDCCAGLAFLHSKNLMHCDIKSLNFLVCSDLTVKLSDLGETRLLGDNHDADSSNDQRDMPVNVNWSSPELLSGQRHLVNQAADVWSLAMVIVEIMTGEVPYDTPEYRSLPLEEFIHRLKANERPSLPKVFLQNLWLEDMLYDAWHFDPALRCSAESMLKVFEENLKE